MQLLGGRHSIDPQSVKAGEVRVSPVAFNLDLHVTKNTVVRILEGDMEETNTVRKTNTRGYWTHFNICIDLK